MSSKTLVLPALTACIWTLAAAGMTYWVLALTRVDTQSVPLSPSTAVAMPEASAQWVSKALGKSASAPEPMRAESQQFQLYGVISSPSGQGSALIGIGGEAPKPYRVGQFLQEGVSLQSLTSRKARLISSGGEIWLELPIKE